MLLRSHHSEKKLAKQEVKTWKKQGFNSDIIPGDTELLGNEMKFFVYTEEKIKESFNEKLDRANKKFFGDKPKNTETVEERLERANKAVFG